jgi:WD40 repeat protein
MQQHTYLRYECADAFGLTLSSASSKAPPSNQALGFLKGDDRVVLTTTGSFVTALSLQSGEVRSKIGHRTQFVGLNADEVVCFNVYQPSAKVATGWVDGAVRIFEDTERIFKASYSLLDGDDDDNKYNSEPLVLNGHGGSPVRTVVFDGTGSRLASGGSDGTVILWDVLDETGLFRLIGHRGAISDLAFVSIATNLDGLISCSLDGLVKIWDLQAQCCTQTLANHRGPVLAGACMALKSESKEQQQQRWRLVTGSNDGQVRVWSMHAPTRSTDLTTATVISEDEELVDSNAVSNQDDVCHYMGRLVPPPTVSVSAEKIACIQYSRNGRYLGILQANSKTVDVYLIRSTQESLKKRQRRLKRRQEKKKKQSTADGEKVGKKRGILDDPESSGSEVEGNAEDAAMDPELLKASDEFEYLATVRASHKIRAFVFCTAKEKGELVRIVCGLATNALETHSLSRKSGTGYVYCL